MLYTSSECPICGTGARGFRLCSDRRTVVVMCDECDSVWIDAMRLEPSEVVYPRPPDFVPDGLTYSIASPESRWATRSEVQLAGWEDLIAGEADTLGGC
jgi:hypothetical protein